MLAARCDHTMKLQNILPGCLLAVNSLFAALPAVESKAEVFPQYDQLFRPTHGWVGGDGAYSVALTNDLTLWLYSDTWIGEIRDGKRANVTMVNNTVAVQRGFDPATARVEFFYGTTPAGKPTALITPEDGKGWFWIYDGIMTRDGLFLFLMQIEKAKGNSAFGFKTTGAWLGHVSNPLAPPTQWKVTQKKIPGARFGPGEERLFGSAVLKADGFIYIYGAQPNWPVGKAMLLARVPEGKLADFNEWRFYAKGEWSNSADDASPLCAGLANEYSVSWQPALKQYVAVFTENGISRNIKMRTASVPSGPWSAPVTIYQCPETNKNTFCYAAKAHPTLAQSPDELIVTYAVNANDFWQVLKDASLYWPQFLKVKVGAKPTL